MIRKKDKKGATSNNRLLKKKIIVAGEYQFQIFILYNSVETWVKKIEKGRKTKGVKKKKENRPTTGLGARRGLEWATKHAKVSSSPGRSTTWASYATMIDTSCIILTPACSGQRGGEEEGTWWRSKVEECSWQVLFPAESGGGEWLPSRVPQESSPAQWEEGRRGEWESSTTHLFVSPSPSV